MKINFAYDKQNQIHNYVYELSKKHCGNYEVSDNFDDSDYEISLKTDLSLESEAYKIEFISNKNIIISASDKLGLLYGVGRFFHKGNSLNENEYKTPEKKIRGIYFATHFNNYYQEAPIEKLLDYTEELVFWGANSIAMWFDMHHFYNINDPSAQKLLHRMKLIYIKAKEIGLKTTLCMLSNEYYYGAKEEFLATNSIEDTEYFAKPIGYYHKELCPSVPEAKELLITSHMEVINEFKEPGLDYIWFHPYDQGGCTCESCRPWGSNGFIKLSFDLVNELRKTNLSTTCILSTWRFDCFTNGEWQYIVDNMSKISKYFKYIMADFEFRGIPNNLKEIANKHGVNLVGFPEISMTAVPWGGFGATPVPERTENLYKRLENMHQGGFAYSEGIFEDINKVIILGLYFGNSSAKETVKDYFRFYFSEDTVKLANEFINCLEELIERNRINADGEINNYPTDDYVENLPTFKIHKTGKIKRACELAEIIKNKLPISIQNSDRFKILYLRTVIDKALIENDGYISIKTETAAKELEEIFYAQNSDYAVAPITENAIRNNKGHI